MSGSDFNKLATVCFVIGFLSGSIGVGYASVKYYRAQAVNHGCGYFPVSDSTTGDTKFEWCTPSKGEQAP